METTNIVDIATIISALATFVVAIVAAYSARIANRSARIAARSADEAKKEAQHNYRLTSVNIVAQAFRDFTMDEDMQKVFYEVEHGNFNYRGIGALRAVGMEEPTDKLLRHFSVLAIAWKNNLVKDDTLRTACYYMLKVLDNPSIQEYMERVCNVAAMKSKSPTDIGEHPYKVLLEMGEKLTQTPAE